MYGETDKGIPEGRVMILEILKINVKAEKYVFRRICKFILRF